MRGAKGGLESAGGAGEAVRGAKGGLESAGGAGEAVRGDRAGACGGPLSWVAEWVSGGQCAVRGVPLGEPSGVRWRRMPVRMRAGAGCKIAEEVEGGCGSCGGDVMEYFSTSG